IYSFVQSLSNTLSTHWLLLLWCLFHFWWLDNWDTWYHQIPEVFYNLLNHCIFQPHEGFPKNLKNLKKCLFLVLSCLVHNVSFHPLEKPLQSCQDLRYY